MILKNQAARLGIGLPSPHPRTSGGVRDLKWSHLISKQIEGLFN